MMCGAGHNHCGGEGQVAVVKQSKKARTETPPRSATCTAMELRDVEDSSVQLSWPECETCGKQSLVVTLTCSRCSSPVCGDCAGGMCGACGADLQQTFRGCGQCGRVLRRRATRLCVRCDQTWCHGCIDRAGACGCGALTEAGFLRPLGEVEAPLAGPGGARAPGPCLSTASSCNLDAFPLADTAASCSAAVLAARPSAAAAASAFASATAGPAAAAAAAAAAMASKAIGGVSMPPRPPPPLSQLGTCGSTTSAMAEGLRRVDFAPLGNGGGGGDGDDEDDDDGPRCSWTGGGSVCA